MTPRLHPENRRGSRRTAVLVLLALLAGLLPGAAAVTLTAGTAAATTSATGTDGGSGQRRYGTLQSSTANLPRTTAAGVDLVTLSVAWNRFEPVEGQVDATYVAQLRASLAAFRQAGTAVVLSPGVQYAPAWVLADPDSRFVNQFGDAYAPTESGKKIANMVFVQRLRDNQKAYLQRLFAALGTDFYGVRLGGGWYGELNYPEPSYAGRTNAYWGYDPVATGARPGLATGVTRNPVPGWRPGTASTDHASARAFSEWYLDSLDNYHDWQISTVRAMYPGRLLMMYPSWGVRPGQLDAAVAGDLSGTTSAERNGEVQRGFDFARFVRGITDPGVVLYTTWLNADTSADTRTDQRYWSPVKFLAHLSAQRTQPLALMGENTGRDSVTDMAVTFSQARAYELIGVVWAFEPDLFSTGTGYATVADLSAAVAEDRRLSSTAAPVPTASPTSSPTSSPTTTAPSPSVSAATAGPTTAAPSPSPSATTTTPTTSPTVAPSPSATTTSPTVAPSPTATPTVAPSPTATPTVAPSPTATPTTSPTVTPTSSPTTVTRPRALVPVPHTRVLDTVTGTGTKAGRLVAGQVVVAQVSGRAGVPADAEAVVLRVSGTAASTAGWLKAYPAGRAAPSAADVQLPAWTTESGLVVVPLGTLGRVEVRAGAAADVSVDVQGYVPAGSSYTPSAAQRVLDTRNGTGVRAGRLPADTVTSFQVRGVKGVPSDATSVVMLVTAVGSTASGELGVGPSGSNPWRPAMRYAKNETKAVLVLGAVGADGRVSVRTSSSSHVVVDVQGWAGPADITSVLPDRILDTRNGTGVPAAAVPPGGSVLLQVAGRGGVPTGARSAVLHTTVLAPATSGGIHLNGSDQVVPASPVVGFGAGHSRAAPALVALGADGRVRFTNRSKGTVHLTVEVEGWTTR